MFEAHPRETCKDPMSRMEFPAHRVLQSSLAFPLIG
jgi:hypothetical protein